MKKSGVGGVHVVGANAKVMGWLVEKPTKERKSSSYVVL